MPSTRRFLSTDQLDFLAYREALKEYLQSQDKFLDFNFEGSNMAILLDLLALNTFQNGFYLNMIGSEMFLDTARLLDSAYSRAKELNYVPRSRTSARAVVTCVVDVNGQTPDTVTIPKYHPFVSQGFDEDGNSISYQFITDSAHVVQRGAGGTYVSANVEIFEGVLVREVFTVNSTSTYVLQSANIDIDSIEVVVQTSNTDTTNSEWTRAENLYGLTEEDEVWFLQGAYDGRYEIVFGNGTIGKELETGNLVRVFYRDTTGEEANLLGTFASDDLVEGFELDTVTTITRAYGGSEKEDVDGIRFNAPRHFTTQERAVTKADFINLVRQRFPQLEAVTAYGGEEVTPKQYGRVIISVKPAGGTVISNQLKNDIIAYLTGKNIVTESVIQDPEFLYLKINSNVVYDKDRTTKSHSEIVSLVREAIETHVDDELEDFGIDFRYSQLVRDIDDADESIVSNDTEVTLVRRWSPNTGSTQSLVFSFDNRLRDETRSSQPLTHDGIVYSDAFGYVKNQTEFEAVLQDDGDGTIIVYTTDDGERVVLESDIGTVNYASGDVSLTLNVASYSGYISIHGVTEGRDVTVRANKFLTVDPEDITVTVTDAED